MQINLEALAGLLVENAKKGDFLASLKDENGEYLSEAEILPKIRAQVSTRLKGQMDYGLKKRSEEIEDVLRKNGIEPNEGERLESVVERLSKSRQELTKEQASKMPIFQELLNDAKKDIALTPDNAMSNPVVQQLVQRASERVKGEHEATIQRLQSELTQRDQMAIDAQLRAAVSTHAEALKLDLSEDKDMRQKRLNALYTIVKQKVGKVVVVDGEVVPADEKGNPIVNDLGFTVSLKDVVLNESPFAPLKFDPRQTAPPAPNSQHQRQPPAGSSFVFAGNTPEERAASYMDQRTKLATDPVKRAELNRAWQEAQQSQPQ